MGPKKPTESGPAGPAHLDPKRSKVFSARTISTQTSGRAFSGGHVDLNRFVASKKYEITAIERGLKSAKKVLASRAFQEVPVRMRRRTASHDVKRVPVRLRARAKREMACDRAGEGKRIKAKRGKMRMRVLMRDAATRERKAEPVGGDDGDVEMVDPVAKQDGKTSRVGPVLAFPTVKPSRFRNRQKHKIWLPTHLFHAKRARMTSPDDPLWGFSIPMTPSEKSFRTTHRAHLAAGAICWDVSYTATIELDGDEQAIVSLFRQLGWVDPDTDEHQDWKSGWCSRTEWIFEAGTRPRRPIAPATVIWKPGRQATTRTRKAMVRINPAGFSVGWDQIVAAAACQRPAVAVRDARFEIGSVDVAGPAALDVVSRLLRPAGHPFTPVWRAIALGRADAAAKIEPNAVLGFDVLDPRLHLPARSKDGWPGKLVRESIFTRSTTVAANSGPHHLFEVGRRETAAAGLVSQATIDRFRREAVPGSEIEIDSKNKVGKDGPTVGLIPVIVFGSSDIAPTTTVSTSTSRISNTVWTILLPWKAVDQFWHALVRIQPTGATRPVLFGGIDERRQVSLERELPWFPADFPGTDGGDGWNTRDRLERLAELDRKPRAKQPGWKSLDLANGDPVGEIGAGPVCDWDVFVDDCPSGRTSRVVHVSSAAAKMALSRKSQDQVEVPPLGLAVVRITVLGRGVPGRADRVYRIPACKVERDRWTALYDATIKKWKPSGKQIVNRDDQATDQSVGLDDDPAVSVPTRADLIGFVTSGTYNLRIGRGSGIASVLVSKLVDGISSRGFGLGTAAGLCVLRKPGTNVARLAKWEVV